ncbi:MAG TPA: nucleoside-diphosphate kinase [Candidatus Polarisedimenticolia bacterium]|jgi:nucleoside-diphosphate kinase|nr:nucleoside-diphosphate kinase [Candidatus Polarisedimenticolia bacterium]
MERTLTIIKPDGVAANLVGEVIRRLEAKGLRPAAMKLLRLSPDQAAGFYHVHRERGFFDSLVGFMTSGPVVVMVLEGDGAIARLRELMGATDPAKAAAGTIRKDFASSIEKNIIHGSDSAESAEFEIGYFFNRLEICRR